MSRPLDTATEAAAVARYVVLAFMADLTFKSGTAYAWTGIGPLVWNGNTYLGVGQLGKVGDIIETTAVQATGTTLTLNGINPALYADCMDECVTGLPAIVRMALLDPQSGAILGTPIILYDGQVDLPEVSENANDITITLHLENALTNLQRANRRLYTAADQAIKYPTDSGFAYVSALSCTANQWG